MSCSKTTARSVVIQDRDEEPRRFVVLWCFGAEDARVFLV